MSNHSHGEREQIADEIIEFVNIMEDRWTESNTPHNADDN